MSQGSGQPSGSVSLPVDQQEIYVSIWAKAVDTQMHFNEMSVKARQFGLGFVAAALGLGIVLLTQHEDVSIPISFPMGGFDLNVTVLIILASALAMRAVQILDLNVYHKMLRGAVTFGEDFEQNYLKKIFPLLNKGMTQAISHYSRHEDADVESHQGVHTYLGKNKKNSYKKIRNFYRLTIWSLIILAFAVFIETGHFGHPSTANTAVHAINDKLESHAK